MRHTLEDIIINYSHGDTELLSYDIDKDHFMELLKKYLNDKNSSTLRQEIMCQVAGVKPNPNKLGFDGEGTVDEMKPKNVETLNPKSKKLSGVCNYSDMTYKRHIAFCEQGAQIHIGGFVDGKHIFQIKVPYKEMESHFEDQLKKRLPNGDQPNQYLRSMGISLKHIKKCNNVTITYLTKDLEDYSDYITGPLYKYIKELEVL